MVCFLCARPAKIFGTANKATPIGCIWFRRAAKTFGICEQTYSRPKGSGFCVATQRNFQSSFAQPYSENEQSIQVVGFCSPAQRKALEQKQLKVLNFVLGFGNKATQINCICSAATKKWNCEQSISNGLDFVQPRKEKIWNGEQSNFKWSGFCLTSHENFRCESNGLDLLNCAAKKFGMANRAIRVKIFGIANKQLKWSGFCTQRNFLELRTEQLGEILCIHAAKDFGTYE
jgi:hypothetical protein